MNATARRTTRNAFPLAEFDSMLEGFIRPTRTGKDQTRPRVPAIDVTEFSNRWLIEAELPGVTKEEIAVTFKAGRLTIEAVAAGAEPTHDPEPAEEAAATAGDDGRLVLCERQAYRYARTLSVGRRIDADNIRASFADGVLRLTLPKLTSDALYRRIEIV